MNSSPQTSPPKRTGKPLPHLTSALDHLESRSLHISTLLHTSAPSRSIIPDNDYSLLKLTSSLTRSVCTTLDIFTSAHVRCWSDATFRQCALRCLRLHRNVRDRQWEIGEMFHEFRDWRRSDDEFVYERWLDEVVGVELRAGMEARMVEIMLVAFLGEMADGDRRWLERGFGGVDDVVTEDCLGVQVSAAQRSYPAEDGEDVSVKPLDVLRAVRRTSALPPRSWFCSRF
ncbi:uncharacterized protein H6S33_010989 [Morchella sextelata]|uniref:uncharacterized protein n=1 Tax=Morchella sextelata TaxID=1174677 RepID=UPI001D059BA9|nr:uncharacterized protein H6S33_010989 [Morchella sextelata]KAH0611724.1 hypothetical protein H6S33_010989 [Morchella sextelata]